MVAKNIANTCSTNKTSQKSRTFHGSRPQTMGCAWPQTIPNGEQPGRCQAKNPERFMVAARKPWDAPGLKLLQKHKYKLNIIEINVRINTESFFFI